MGEESFIEAVKSVIEYSDPWSFCISGLAALFLSAAIRQFLPKPVSREERIARELEEWVNE